MHWSEIKIYIPLAECKDSLLYDSGEVIAQLTSTVGIDVKVAVAGELRILYKDNIYRYIQNYPPELAAAISSGEIYQLVERGQAEIQNSNWFEILVSYHNQTYAEVLEPPLCEFTSEALRAYLIDYIEKSFPDFLESETHHFQ